MTTALASTLEATARDERGTALRELLRQPLVSGRHDASTFALIVRHRDWLQDWFSDRLGWSLVVDADFARLHKVPAQPDGSRPLRLSSSKPPFTRRRYALLCLSLAALDDGAAQTTLGRLAELVAEQGDESGQPFDATLFGERRAFVDALQWLEVAGVLALRDGDAERYAASGDADALYDVNDHLLGQLISAPVPPSLAPDRARMMEPPYAETEEGQRQRMRHGVLRRLVDDPVLYLEDLVPGEREWLEQSRGFVYRLLRNDLGLVVEKRAEGLAGVDPDGDVTDLRFPDGRSTLKHMALLLGERMVEMARHDPDRAVEWSVVELAAVGRELAASYGEPCGWKKEHLGSGPAVDDLTEQALALLAGFGLVRRTTRGWAPRPALARFRPMTPDTWEQQQ